MNWGVFTGLGIGLIMAVMWKEHAIALHVAGCVSVAIGVFGEMFS